MNRTSQILTITVLSVLAVILIVCILKHNKENLIKYNQEIIILFYFQKFISIY